MYRDRRNHRCDGMRHATSSVAGGLKRQAAGVRCVVLHLHLPMRRHLDAVVTKAMRPYAMLGQQQRKWQQEAEKTGQ